ncbi:hypothetical protein TIFTF001_017767 [Ficus carica]|uniref:Uncharacterized protein n=1 Tax=Ficus carica TaxID=3494 RepID=A0AA88ALT0_FICCA|nr:hypothetical protein TIFTF001_017767 [Ficus carica]
MTPLTDQEQWSPGKSLLHLGCLTRSCTTDVTTTSGRSEIPQGLPVAPAPGPPSGNSSPESWGPRIADEDLDMLLRQLYPARGLRIEEPMAD